MRADIKPLLFCAGAGSGAVPPRGERHGARARFVGPAD